MKQSRLTPLNGLLIAIILVLSLILGVSHCNHPGWGIHQPGSNPVDSGGTLNLHPDTAMTGGGGLVLVGNVLESAPGGETSTSGDELAFIYGGSMEDGFTNSQGQVRISFNGSDPTSGPVYIEGDVASTHAVAGRMINALLTGAGADTGWNNPMIIVPTTIPTSIPVQIFATDLSGNPYSGATVVINNNSTGLEVGTSATTKSNGKIVYGTNLSAGGSYTVVVTGGVSSAQKGGTSTFSISTTPQSCSSPCAFSYIQVFMRY